MWHAEALDQEHDKIIRKVITCQKIVRGFLCRRRLNHLLQTVERHNNERVQLINQIHKQGQAAANEFNYINIKIDVNINLFFLKNNSTENLKALILFS
jgi:hypothetical protein